MTKDNLKKLKNRINNGKFYDVIDESKTEQLATMFNQTPWYMTDRGSIRCG